jgi:hypothetical protein
MKKMNPSLCLFACSLMMTLGSWAPILADNQTATVSEIHSDDSLPFRVKLKKVRFILPKGVQSYIHGIHNDKWLIIAGRIDGLHGFDPNSKNNFPPSLQNRNIFVIDPIKKKTYIRSLKDPHSGLTQAQIDLLSVTAPQGYQSGRTLYMTGGYGIDTASGTFTTKNALTAIDIPGLMHWVINPSHGETAAEHIRQIFDDIFKVTGGYMQKIKGDHPTLLVMGQEFEGFYNDQSQQPPAFQKYSRQVRRFHIHDNGKHLSFTPERSLPPIPDPNLRRRDLNVVPVVRKMHKKLEQGFVGLSGVFTPSFGVWTVPVEITADGQPSMADPTLPSTFKQGMNNYDCATFGLFSEKTGDMYTVLLGGISFGFFAPTQTGFEFQTDPNIPFISQTTVVRINEHGKYKQYFLPKGGFPTILSKKVNAGNPFLFGAESEVILFQNVSKYSNDVIKLDKIKKRTVIGYVVGGIKSTLPNTTSTIDSEPSRYLFKVIVEPVRH